jgi:rubredoxin/mannose-6-phosphate isomerase-like protein (cupin superfamily)
MAPKAAAFMTEEMLMSSAEVATTPGYTTFAYKKPTELSGDKMILELAKSRLIRGRVQVVRSGGENNLHSHDGMDGFWMVLSGRVRFYGPGDKVIAELGRFEGILLPAGEPYWFESADESVDLELLQMAAFDPATPLRRNDHEALKIVPGTVEVVDIAQKAASASGDKAMQKYICSDCDYEYDPALGDPSQSIAPGTSFDDLPDTWLCPECGAPKSEFYPVIEAN